jgi:hypothetical protein
MLSIAQIKCIMSSVEELKGEENSLFPSLNRFIDLCLANELFS